MLKAAAGPPRGARDPVAERGLNVKNSAAMPRLAWDNNERSKNKKLLIALICYPQVGHRNIKPTWGYFYVQKK